MNEKQQVTAATLMALYNVTRPTAINWFNDGLIVGEKGDGLTDSWITTAEALTRFHLSLTAVNVWRGGDLLNLPGPWAASVNQYATSLGVTRAMGARYVKAGRIPGAVKLPYATGPWRLPVNYEATAAALAQDNAGLQVQIGPPVNPLGPLDKLLKGCG